MTSVQTAHLSSIETLAVEFFRRSEGQWHSQRRYYTLHKEVEPQEVVSQITVRFLEPGSPELRHLAALHEFEDQSAMVCGSQVSWESNYSQSTRKPSSGSTVFGVLGNILYRDRGFATPQPVIATFAFPNPQTMCLKTEYKGSVFEEELKLIGASYRTRQTIISRAGEEQMIGQYLEKRVS